MIGGRTFRKGQSSLEYLLVVVAALILIAISVRIFHETANNTPHYYEVPLDPYIFPKMNTSDGEVRLEAWLSNNGDGTYKANYRIWVDKPGVKVTKAQLALICMNKPENVAGYEVITHQGLLTYPNYWANYWTPIKEEYFPCEIRAYVWKS